MRVLVCIKQVPDTTRVAIDEKTGSLIRGGVDSKINIYDLHALEAAFELKEKTGCKITVLTMGPPQAERAVREAIALGADDGCLVTDRAFAGADVLATSYTLYQAISELGNFDLLLCGKQTTDGDTAQVGPALAEHMGIPHAACITKIIDSDKNGITFEQDLTESLQDVRFDFPCLLTIEKGNESPRLPSYRRKKQFEGVGIRRLTLADLNDKDTSRYGAEGSPTRVERIFPPARNDDNVMLEGDAGELAKSLLDILVAQKIV